MSGQFLKTKTKIIKRIQTGAKMPASREREDVAFICCKLCEQVHLAPASQRGSYTCDDCCEAKRNPSSKSKAKLQSVETTEVAPKKISQTIGHFDARGSSRNTEILSASIDHSQAPASSRAKKVLSTAIESKKERKKSQSSKGESTNPDACTVAPACSDLKCAFDNMEGELTCPICLELFAKPVTLNEW